MNCVNPLTFRFMSLHCEMMIILIKAKGTQTFVKKEETPKTCLTT